MIKKRKTITHPVKKQKKNVVTEAIFMGLSRSQARSLAIGTLIVGIGLFALAGVTWQNKGALQTSIFPTSAPTITTQPSQMISATSTAKLKEPFLVKELPYTTSRVTYTVAENDNLAKIGKELCGTENAWVSIAETNKLLYPYFIHAGETYIITCN